MATSYTKTGGSGDRRLRIAFSSSIGFNDAIINGAVADEQFSGSAATGAHLTFDFGNQHVIDEARWYQSNAATHGTWQWQGGNDGSAWTNIGASFTLGGGTIQTQSTLNGNATAYRYYRLFGLSGSFNSGPWIREIEFRIDDPVIPYVTTAWLTGDQTESITVSKSSGLSFNGDIKTLVNGAYSNDLWSGAALSGQWLQFDLHALQIVDGAVWVQSGAGSHGVMRWQGSTDASSWTDIGENFTFPSPQMHSFTGGARGLMQSLAQNRTAYRYYRLLGISGNFNSGPYMREIEFRMDERGELIGDPHARVTHVVSEALTGGTADARVTHVVVESLQDESYPGIPSARVTHVVLEILNVIGVPEEKQPIMFVVT